MLLTVPWYDSLGGFYDIHDGTFTVGNVVAILRPDTFHGTQNMSAIELSMIIIIIIVNGSKNGL